MARDFHAGVRSSSTASFASSLVEIFEESTINKPLGFVSDVSAQCVENVMEIEIFLTSVKSR